MLDVSAPRVLAIGDSLHTDIAGAKGAGIDSLWVLGGIHWNDFAGDFAAANAAAAEQSLAPKFVAERLIW
jgi:ribonucleotide monophosphatase NagD (HAD superfamily)